MGEDNFVLIKMMIGERNIFFDATALKIKLAQKF